MNAALFLSTMKKPEKVSGENLDWIKQMSRKYPFSANLAITQALALHELGDIQFEDALKEAAAKTLSRKKLKSLIEGPIIPDWNWNAVKDGENPEAAPAEGQEEKIPQTDEPPAEEQSWVADENPVTSIVPVGQNPFAFQFVKVGKTGKPKNTNKEKTATGLSKKSGIKPSSSRKSEDSLIDKFIETSPRISTPTLDFGDYKPEDLAARSSVLDEEIITENMASIYMKQKNFAKAIELYRKLQLKIPEKHDYFATLIKNMELSMLQK
jgi:hypothetical protein